MGFWENGIGKLETQFRLLILNMFSLRRMSHSIASHLMLLKCARCIRIEGIYFGKQKQ